MRDEQEHAEALTDQFGGLAIDAINEMIDTAERMIAPGCDCEEHALKYVEYLESVKTLI